MNNGIQTLLFIGLFLNSDLPSFGDAADEPVSPATKDFENQSTDNKMNGEAKGSLDQEIAMAPSKLEFTIDGKFTIGIGVYGKDGTFSPRTFAWEELEPFYKDQVVKSIVVIKINPRPKALQPEEIRKISDRFQKIGYARVVIVRSLASGYLLELDTSKSQK